MDKQVVFDFKMDISNINISTDLNNPFDTYVPEIAAIAAKEFQNFIYTESQQWNYDFETRRGKMFGVLVVQLADNSYAYLGTISGKLPGNNTCNKFVPSVFDVSTDNYFINKGMTELTEIGTLIKNSSDVAEILLLKETRKQKSIGLQRKLFENYYFLTVSGVKKNLLEIFSLSSHGNPPVAAGECAAPKLLNYALKNNLKPIALTEFWWGNSAENKEIKQGFFYPACKNRCRPVLEFMLEDSELFSNAISNNQ